MGAIMTRFHANRRISRDSKLGMRSEAARPKIYSARDDIRQDGDPFYRNCASEFELLAEAEPLPEARLRYRTIAQHYRELADRDERSDKARMAETLELLRLKRRQAAE
jgi:hypothetical protein